jgi:hypothetical protein
MGEMYEAEANRRFDQFLLTVSRVTPAGVSIGTSASAHRGS